MVDPDQLLFKTRFNEIALGDSIRCVHKAVESDRCFVLPEVAGERFTFIALANEKTSSSAISASAVNCKLSIVGKRKVSFVKGKSCI